MTQLTIRLVLSVLTASALTACVSPSYPINAPSAAMAAPAVVPAEPMVVAEAVEPPPLASRSAAKVEARELADLPAPQATAPPQAIAPPAVPAADVERASPDRHVITRSVTGKIVSVEAPGRSYKVRRGDTLEKIAIKLDTEIKQLARDNRLKTPYRLKPGQVLQGPPTTAKAYVVGDGDTLFAIAKRFNVSVDALRSQNGLGRRASLSAGRKLRLPAGYRDKGPVTTSGRPGGSDDEDRPPSASLRPHRKVELSTPDEVEPRADTARSVTTRSITGRVVDIEGPAKRYTVRKGDNLEKIARKLDTEVDDLAKDNRLKKPYRLQPGQSLKGPSSSAKAYIVGRDDTLAGIARRFGVTETALRQANGLKRGAGVGAGHRLRLPAGYRDRGPNITTTRVIVEAPDQRAPAPTQRLPAPTLEPTPRPVADPSAQLPSAPQPYRGTARPSSSASVVNGAPVASPPPSDTQITQMGRGVFAWPLRGEVLSSFGGRGNGPRNDGLNIRANAGDAVRAAASGDVVYAGDQVPGFGNLVLIKHADGWITAYGHLGHVDVRMQQKVNQGQTIGQAGSSGGVSEPQLHFEVRYAPNPQERARPVDPALVLPR